MPRDKTGHFYYSWFPTIFNADTQHLSLAEDGAYRRLLDHYMMTRAPLPANDAALARIVGIGLAEWAEVKEAIKPFFKPSENPAGFLVHSFCREALNIHDARINNSRLNGKKGGRPRAQKNNDNNPAGYEIITQQKPDNRTEQSKEEKEPNGSLSPPRPARPVKPPVYPPEFEELWKAYPRNNGEKYDALKSYLKARKDTDHGRIIEGARAYRQHCEREGAERRYIKHASTWLNARGWETERDGLQPVPSRRPGGTTPGYSDPASTARDIGEAIIERRRLERERAAAESQPGGAGRADAASVPDLFQPKNLR